MRVLTVRQPWAWAIMHGKSPENRSQLWTYTGAVAIHAGAQIDAAAMEHPAIARLLFDLGFDRLPPQVTFGTAVRLHTSAVLGVVQMLGGHYGDDDCCPGNAWADRTQGTVHLALRNPRPFLTPITGVRGRLGLWKPDEDLMHAIGERLAGVVANCSLGHPLARAEAAGAVVHLRPSDLLEHTTAGGDA